MGKTYDARLELILRKKGCETLYVVYVFENDKYYRLNESQVCSLMRKDIKIENAKFDLYGIGLLLGGSVSGVRLVEKYEESLAYWCEMNEDWGERLKEEYADRRVSMNEISSKSAVNVLWKCSEGHEWYASLHDRVGKGSKCPICSGSVVSQLNSLKSWCDKNGSWGKQVLKEYSSKNEKRPDEISYGSSKDVLWECSFDTSHQWYAPVVRRTHNSSGCPYCSGIKVSKKNSLYSWCIKNGKWGEQLLREYSSKNEKSVHEVSYGSCKEVVWNCQKNPEHEWKDTIHNRTFAKAKCPKCLPENSLIEWCNCNGELGRRILADFNDKVVDLRSLKKYSNKKVDWKCSVCGYEWVTTVGHRVYGRGCPRCSGTLVSEKNSLEGWCMEHGEIGKQILKEYSSENELKPDEIHAHSNKKVKWVCQNNPEHTWEQMVNQRTRYFSKCPHCYNRGTSYPEQFLLATFRQRFKEVDNRVKLEGFEADILIKDIKVVIEYNGNYYHADKLGRDELKREKFQGLGYRVVSINEMLSPIPYIAETEDGNFDFYINYGHKDDSLKELVKAVFKHINIGGTENIDFRKVSELAYKYSSGLVQEGKSISILYEELIVKEWSPSNVLKPEQLTPGSHKTVLWICSECGGEYRATVQSKIRDRKACPHCGWRFFTYDYIKIPGSIKVFEQFPELETEYDSSLNFGIRPEDLSYGSKETVKWHCRKCGNVWRKRVYDRTHYKSGCPRCGANVFREAETQAEAGEQEEIDIEDA